ncbi:hypothetical protein IH824_15790 [candidate division KSB1 bacterium]|nr:hypothetical protein [candidate division KSB1 bacterium]
MKAPSSTWTYLINDNTFEDMLGRIDWQCRAAGVFGYIVAFDALLPFGEKIAQEKIEVSLSERLV